MCIAKDIITVASTTIDTVELATTNRKDILYFYRKFFKRRIKVLVYGDTGVGKTQFLLTLTGNNSYAAPARTRQLQHFDLVLRTGRRVRLIDTPGHKTNLYARNQALDQMTKGKIDGIINLVDYGYQDSEILQNHPETAFQEGSSNVKQEYLKNNRKLEIERTKEIVNRITPTVHPKWFVTLINKADIWHQERDSVIKYYEEEPSFKDAMENLEHAISVTVCPFCSVITPFGNRIMQLSYSEHNKRMDYDNLINVIEEFVEGRHEQQ